MMGVMSIQFPSMLVLYWVIGNLIQMVQTYFIVVLPSKKELRKKNNIKILSNNNLFCFSKVVKQGYEYN